MSDAGEIIKSGAFDKLADVAHKLAGPLAEELGLLLADKAKLYRLKNWINVVKKTEKILQEANLPPTAVPPRMFLPILEASSVENDEILQDLWAGLLASASERSDSLSPSFIETLKQLTPSEAKMLNILFPLIQLGNSPKLGTPDEMRSIVPGNLDDISFRLMTETFERLGLIRRQYDLQQPGHSPWDFIGVPRSNKSSPWLFGSLEKEETPLPELTYEFEFTEYGAQFMSACQGPKK